MPPNVGSICMRLRCCELVPHDAVQVDQQRLVTQLTAQAKVLQARVSPLCEQALAPRWASGLSGGTGDRGRRRGRWGRRQGVGNQLLSV